MAALDGEGDPPVDDCAKDFVVGQSTSDLGDTVGADEAADWLAAMHVGQFAIGAVSLRLLGVHTATAWLAANLVLAGDAARMQGAESQEFLSQRVDFSFDLPKGWDRIHVGYDK